LLTVHVQILLIGRTGNAIIMCNNVLSVVSTTTLLPCRRLGCEAPHSFWSSAVVDSGWTPHSCRFNSEKWARTYWNWRQGGKRGSLYTWWPLYAVENSAYTRCT
jgi:hypothetical protein